MFDIQNSTCIFLVKLKKLYMVTDPITVGMLLEGTKLELLARPVVEGQLLSVLCFVWWIL
ncbi:hypothetical protein CFP56_029199 [Quercus suber]|uniref:Uncharacterized protein n=1 Tax=Quercus suber TaxID=58331 RepID=A0AAW0ME71_QUESU